MAAKKKPKRLRLPRHRNPEVTPEAERAVAEAVLDKGKSLKQAAVESGIGSEQVVKVAVARERGRREALEADPTLNLKQYLSLSAQQKFEALERRLRRNLELEIQERARVEAIKGIEELLVHYREKLAWAEKVEQRLNTHKRPLSSSEFTKLLSIFHTDRFMNADGKFKDRITECFQILQDRKAFLVDEPVAAPKTPSIAFPKNYAELMAQREAIRAERRARKGGLP